MLHRPLKTGHSKYSVFRRSKRFYQWSAALGTMVVVILASLLAARYISRTSPASDGSASKSFFSAESMAEKVKGLTGYVTAIQDKLFPAPVVHLPDKDPIVPVKAYVVTSDSSKVTSSSLTGVVRARHELQHAFRVSGKIRKRYVEIGQRVSHGSPLFDLDPEDYGLQLRNAQANLDVAEATLKRATADAMRAAELRRANANTASEYEKMLSEREIALGQRESALKQLELARNQLSYCRLVADTAGVITALHVEAGQVVTAGFHVAELARTDELEAVVDIPENRIPTDHDLEATVSFWSLPEVQLSASLREISPVADPATRTYRARFTIVDPPPQIKLGMTATVQWVQNAERHRVVIPTTSLFERDKKPTVWLIDPASGTIHPRPVEVALIGDREIVLASGLSSGDTIVAAGVQKLDERMRVRVWEANP